MEFEFIDWLRERLPAHPQLLLGPGDDAAVLRFAGPDCLVTVDLLTDGVDFELSRVGGRRVGHKALAVNLSDIAAMAGQPVAAVVAVALPQQDSLVLAQELYLGMLPLVERYGLAVAGGDTNVWDGPLAIAITVLAEPPPGGAVRRDGARPGDQILVTGTFGGSLLGKHLDFEPRINAALSLAPYGVRAMIDVSDGLSLDLHRIAKASGCGAAVDLAQVPVSAAAAELAAHRNDGSTALDHALSDGEDFELILAVPPEAADAMLSAFGPSMPLTCIGEFIREPGLWRRDGRGRLQPLPPRGWEHGRSR